MATAFTYRPKFVDIRVNKPRSEAAPEPRRPDERPCDHLGCRAAGAFKAPKGRDLEGQYWWFCQDHAADYNRRFNYFAGMSDEELMAYSAKEAVGHRPTWSFKAGKADRLSAAYRNFADGRRRDPFGVFGAGEAGPRVEPKRARVSRMHVLALETLGLDEDAEAGAIRARYAELVKRFHPDSNGGDRSAEAQLHKVIRAFQTLKAGGLA